MQTGFFRAVEAEGPVDSRRQATYAASIGLFALTVVLLGLGRAALVVPPASVQIQQTSSIGTQQTAKPGRLEPFNPNVRVIEPKRFAPFLRDPSISLERVEAREPLSKLSGNIGRMLTLEIANPDITTDITIRHMGLTLSLEGLKPLDPGRLCSASASVSVSCNTVARKRLLALIASKSVTCKIPEKNKDVRIMAKCTVGTKDLSIFLAANGLAEAEPGTKLEPLTKRARRSRTGMFRFAIN